jgi:hypothetical protein
LYYNARYYDPVVGRFVSADTVQDNRKGFDPYAYVRGNPLTLTDPTGHWSWWGTATIIVGAVATVGSGAFIALATVGVNTSAPALGGVLVLAGACIGVSYLSYTAIYAAAHHRLPNTDAEWDQYGIGLAWTEGIAAVGGLLTWGGAAFGGMLFETSNGVGAMVGGMPAETALRSTGYNIAANGWGTWMAGLSSMAGSVISVAANPPQETSSESQQQSQPTATPTSQQSSFPAPVYQGSGNTLPATSGPKKYDPAPVYYPVKGSTMRRY